MRRYHQSSNASNGDDDDDDDDDFIEEEEGSFTNVAATTSTTVSNGGRHHYNSRRGGGRSNNGRHIMYSLEMEQDEEEEERDSLLREATIDGGVEIKIPRFRNGQRRLLGLNAAAMARNFNFRKRQNAASARQDTDLPSNNNVRGLLRDSIGKVSSIRNVLMLIVMAVCSLVLVKVLQSNLRLFQPVDIENHPHAPSLGGNRNPNHYQQPKKPRPGGGDDDSNDDAWWNPTTSGDDDDFDDGDSIVPDINMPKSNVGQQIPSVSQANMDNDIGHYWHDPINSPNSSPNYAILKNNETLRKQLQQEFDDRMSRTIALYGQWEIPPWKKGLEQLNNNDDANDNVFANVPNKDLPIANFPNNAWQQDVEYVSDFLQQAKKLVSRVKEAIYEEYGYGILQESSTAKRDEITAQRLLEFRVLVGGGNKNDDNKSFRFDPDTAAADPTTGERLSGIAFLSTPAWDGLIRKLLHSIMTQDEFYVVVAGNANTYLSNNFFQSQVMQFHYIMEPVLHKLGVRLISRNMGMNASVAVPALGGGDIYGEADILWYIPDQRPNNPHPPESVHVADFLHKQAILSGERVPVILSPIPAKILEESDNAVWMGGLQPGAAFCQPTTFQNGHIVFPPVRACRYVNCNAEAKQSGECDKHSSVCWIERSDENPLLQQEKEQDRTVGHQKEGYPSDQEQRLEGRKLAMLMLHALDEALDRYIQQANQDALPLPDDIWHVKPAYDKVRETVRNLKFSACDHFIRKVDPRICHMEMHAFTEWTPRVTPKRNRLKRLVQGNIPDNHESLLEVYHGVDLLPRQWKVPDDEVDVHMVAVATESDHLVNNGAEPSVIDPGEDSGYDDNSWVDNDQDGDYGFDNDGPFRTRHLGHWLPETASSTDRRRKVMTSDIATKGWTVYDAPIGFCDGSSQSQCNRYVRNTCLLANYCHYRSGIMGHGESGKLKLIIPNVKEGIILARYDWELAGGPRVKNLPPDFKYEVTVDGQKTIEQDRVHFAASIIDLTKGLRVNVLMLDSNMAENPEAIRDIPIEIEVRSKKLVQNGNETAHLPTLIHLSHIYYA